MARVYILFFKDKWIQNGPKVIMVLLDTLSDLDKLNYGEYRLPMESVFDVQLPATNSCKVSSPLLSTMEGGQASTYVFN